LSSRMLRAPVRLMAMILVAQMSLGSRAGHAAGLLQDDVDFGHLEPSQFDLDVEIDQALQLNRQKLLVPPGLFSYARDNPDPQRLRRRILLSA
jgi:hypothetical protein